MEKVASDDNRDNHVDSILFDCVNLSGDVDAKKSFFLFAGAGSGKTRSLVSLLARIEKEYGRILRLKGQQIAVITYTNAACDEIKNRLGFNPLFLVATIHSFTWELIRPYQGDIREWLRKTLGEEIEDLEMQQGKGRVGTKTYADRAKSIREKTEKLQSLDAIKRFIYNPNGTNSGKDSLSHSQVISLGAHFIGNKPLMQKIFIQAFPVLLIDESQDTNKELMEAFISLQASHQSEIVLGLFGDSMQRIYLDGKVNLDSSIPPDWAKPKKLMNYRSPERIVRLINAIRATADGLKQIPKNEKGAGIVRLFLCNNSSDREAKERAAAEMMKEYTDQTDWCVNAKRLILEHRMAAKRLGFLELYDSLNPLNNTSFLDGSLPEMRIFTDMVLPIISAKQRNDRFTIARIIKKYSPLLQIDRSSPDQRRCLESAKDAVEQLTSLWENGYDPSCLKILYSLERSKLFDLPPVLKIIASRESIDFVEMNESGNEENEDQSERMKKLKAWDQALTAPFSQVIAYHSYIMGDSTFATHQGIKGLEFSNVMAIVDDEETKGFLFSYDKLFGVKELTKTDIENESEGKDSSNSRTRRLFYVICSRAKESLAVVLYTNDTSGAKQFAIHNGWFDESEIVIF